MTPSRLRDFELGIRHPGAAHSDALSRMHGNDPATLPPNENNETTGQTPDQTSDQTEE